MASKQPGESAKQADPGDLLLVIHAFEARSPDELSFAKGDRIELIERDDDFGDGWYLGKHVGDGRTGLFPEVYTKVVSQAASAATLATTQVRTTRAASTPSAPPSFPSSATPAMDGSEPHEASEAEKKRPASETAKAAGQPAYRGAPSPLNTTSQGQRTASVPNAGWPSTGAASAPPTQRSISLMMEGGHPDAGSPVLNETLSVIDEHITDMNTPRSSLFVSDLRRANDSGSDYSGHPAQRMSYINGNETDEEERNAYSMAEVCKWSADQVAEVLEDIGVERGHCDIFREQEISGEVLLELDQASIFMKEFDLGLVGRRLRTWQKIKTFQDEVKAESRSSTQRRKDNRITPTGSVNGRPMYPGSPLSESYTANGVSQFGGAGANPRNSTPRHSKAGSRDHGHAYRHSSVDSQSKALPAHPAELDATSSHAKKPSLDRNWTMGSSGSPVTTRSSLLGVSNHSQTASTVDLEGSSDGFGVDRGYLSGSEVDGKKHRNVLKKREASSASHSRQSSVQNLQAPQQTKRHSRFGSASSFIASITGKSHDDSMARAEPADPKDTHPFGDSPVVTRLDYDNQSQSATTNRLRESRQPESDQSSLMQPAPARTPTEHLSARPDDKTSSLSPTLVASPLRDSSGKDVITQSPSRTASNATSGAGRSLEMDKGRGVTPTLGPSATRRGPKNKKHTSAYTRGLLKIGPREAMSDCDYSGWMKKKSPSLIATWKPRLFVLRGRRLSYYYSENDTEEQGLIDISNHKVLAADDLLTGIHATVTGAKATPTSPANAQTETMNEAEAAAQADSTLQRRAPDGIFIFKLVPPRAGLSRAVNFTKPAVHYFAVDNIKQGRLWMAALMKATIQMDSSKSVVTTYGQKTISLEKAKAMRQRPPNLQDADDRAAAAAASSAYRPGPPSDDADAESAVLPPPTPDGDDADDERGLDDAGLNIGGLNLSYEYIATEANRTDTSTNGEPEPEPASAPLDGRARARQSTPARDAKNSLRLVRSLSGGMSNRSRAHGDAYGGDDEDDEDGASLSHVSTRSRRAMSGGAAGTGAGSIDATFAGAH